MSSTFSEWPDSDEDIGSLLLWENSLYFRIIVRNGVICFLIFFLVLGILIRNGMGGGQLQGYFLLDLLAHHLLLYVDDFLLLVHYIDLL